MTEEPTLDELIERLKEFARYREELTKKAIMQILQNAPKEHMLADELIENQCQTAILLINNCPEEAVERLQWSYQEHPHNSFMLQYLILAHAKNGQYQEAVLEFQRAKEIFAKTKNKHWEPFKFLGRMQNDANDFDFPEYSDGKYVYSCLNMFTVNFRNAFEECASKSCDSIDCTLIADMYPYNEYGKPKTQDLLNQKLKWLEKAVELDPNNAAAHHMLGKYGDDKSHMEKACQLDPENPSAHLDFAESLKTNNPKEALKHYEKWLSLTDKNPLGYETEKILKKIVSLYLAQDDYENAYRVWRIKADKNVHSTPRFIPVISEAYYLEDLKDESPWRLNTIIENVPTDAGRILFLRGDVYESKGMLDEAIKDYKLAFFLRHPKVAKRYPSWENSLKEIYNEYKKRHRLSAAALVRCCKKLNKLENAAEIFKKTLKANPHDFHALFGLGVCDNMLGKFQESAAAFESIVENYEANETELESFRHYYGDIDVDPSWHVLRDAPEGLDESIEYLKKQIVEKNKTMSSKSIAQLKYFLAIKYFDKKDYENASNTYRDTINKSSSGGSIMARIEDRGEILEHEDKKEKIREFGLEKAVDDFPLNPKVHIALGNFYFKEDNMKGAMFEYFIAAKLGNEEGKKKFEELKQNEKRTNT
ncbi:tetratricopeptide repeat protein [Candidatus Woesearchaeota archaeon]|nr:tetratricopeptide repeat protein [Candidatus Woesearchaeota archaeon]